MKFTGGCTTSLKEVKCDSGTADLDGDAKDAADVMAGCGAMAWLFLLASGIIALLIMRQCLGAGGDKRPFFMYGGLASVGLTWLFLTAGWGNFADSKGGYKDVSGVDPDFGASFAFTVIVWLCLFVYGFLWFLLYARANDAKPEGEEVPDPQAQADGQPEASAYAPSYTANNAGAAADGQEGQPTEAPAAPTGGDQPAAEPAAETRQ